MPSGRLVRTAPSNRGGRSVNPDRMTKFLDRPSPWGLQSFGNSQHLHTQQQSLTGGGTRSVRPQTVYDPSLSWDGLSVHPEAFSKLNIDPRVAGSMLLAGSRVIQTSDELPGGLFAGVEEKGKGISTIDPTLQQQDCNYADGSNAPASVAARSGGAVALTFKDQRFENMMVRPVEIGTAPTSQAVRTTVRPVAGGTGELTRFLLQPAERRAIQAQEQQEKAAREVAKRAELQRRHLVQTLRDRYPRGALAVDGVANQDSEVYGSRAQSQVARRAAAAVHAEGRRERIKVLTLQEPRFGHDPFKHNEEFLGRAETKFMQAKALRPMAPADTHQRLFGATDRKDKPQRTQNLREKDLYGKNYNVVSQTAVQHWPSKQPTRHDYGFMSHPSQQSLECQRSVQGAVAPGDRSTGMLLI